MSQITIVEPTFHDCRIPKANVGQSVKVRWECPVCGMRWEGTEEKDGTGHWTATKTRRYRRWLKTEAKRLQRVIEERS